MTGVVPSVYSGGVMERRLSPGDIMMQGESATIGQYSAVGNSTLPAANIATGIINRIGPTAAFTDTTDNSTNILNAISGNAPAAEGVIGNSFRLLIQNPTLFTMTLAAGAGCILGTGTMTTPTVNWREYLVTILNASPQTIVNAITTNGSNVLTWVLPPGMVALPLGPSPLAINITDGMTIIGTGIPANTTITGITLGQGGTIGAVMSANATANAAAGTPLTLMPTIRFDSLRSGAL